MESNDKDNHEIGLHLTCIEMERHVTPGDCQGVGVYDVDEGEVGGGDVGGVGVPGPQPPEQHVGVVVPVQHPLHLLRQAPVVR